jgi:hypothetical protein
MSTPLRLKISPRPCGVSTTNRKDALMSVDVNSQWLVETLRKQGEDDAADVVKRLLLRVAPPSERQALVNALAAARQRGDVRQWHSGGSL